MHNTCMYKYLYRMKIDLTTEMTDNQNCHKLNSLCIKFSTQIKAEFHDNQPDLAVISCLVL